MSIPWLTGLLLVPVLAVAESGRKVIIDQDAFGPAGPNL